MLPLASTVLGALFTLLTAWGTGCALTRRHRDWPWPVVFGIGCAVLSAALFISHAGGLFNRWIIAAIGVAAVAVGWTRFRFGRPCGWWLAAAPLLVVYLVHALAPEIQPDAITYHLGLVAEWHREGGFSSRVGFYEMLPQGVEMLYSMAVAFGGYPAAKLVHLAFVIAAAASIRQTGSLLKFPNKGAAALIYAAAPVVGVCGTSAYNDAALAFAGAALFYALVRFEQSGDNAWAAAAGAMAGFAYAVKLTGIVFAPAAIAWLLIRRQWRQAAIVAGVATLIGGPWMVRTWVMSGNPVAPLCNRLFENPNFHVSTEERLLRFLSNYGTTPAELPLEATLRGGKTGGMAGAAFLLAPLALLALRRREGRAVLVAMLVAAIPWFFNAGGRFLMPALVFLSILITMPLSSRLAWVLAALQIIASLPTVMDRWTDPAAWRLRGFPWRAAMRMEPEAEYLHRVSWEYRVAELLNSHTRRGDRVLDLNVSTPLAYAQAVVAAPWHLAEADRAVDSLLVAASPNAAWWEATARFPSRPLRAVRFRLTRPGANAEAWNMHEATLLSAGQPVFPSQTWELEADPNPWEAPLAFDRNPASRWQSWQRARDGMSLAAYFPSPLAIEGADILLYQPAAGMSIAAEGLENSAWTPLATEMTWRRVPALNYRQRAMALAKREGFQFILTRSADEGLARLGKDLVANPRDWGVRKLAEYDGVYLLKIE